MHHPEQRPNESTDHSFPNIAYWRQRITCLPDVRMNKVTGARTAILMDRYETETIIDETVRRVADDLGL